MQTYETTYKVSNRYLSVDKTAHTNPHFHAHMHESHHKGMLHHDVDGAAENYPEGIKHSLSPGYSSLCIVIVEQTG